jgi:Arc/MetJ-type ribon-helix-helix transcriptional regulator
VRYSAPTSSNAYFLGVRLTAEEVEQLDRFQKTEKIPTRSDAVRALVRRAGEEPRAGPEFPVTLRTELIDLVEDGLANSEDDALGVVLTLGLAELTRLHAERLPALRRAARDAADRSANRGRAGRAGRELLDR